VIEFLIRRTDGEWFDFPQGSDPYRPISRSYKVVEGHGDARIEVDGCEISFSYEDPGVQMSFEGDISQENAACIAEEVRLQVERVSGQAARVVQVS
jgi:hypothetical protein